MLLIGGVAGGIAGELTIVCILGIVIAAGMQYHKHHNKQAKLSSQITSPIQNRSENVYFQELSSLSMTAKVQEQPTIKTVVNLNDEPPQTQSTLTFSDLPNVAVAQVEPSIDGIMSTYSSDPSVVEIAAESDVPRLQPEGVISHKDQLLTSRAASLPTAALTFKLEHYYGGSTEV